MHVRSTRLVDSAEATAIDEEMMKEDIPAESIYYHEGGGLFPKDVEQHMDVLPEVTESTTEIRIDDGQVGDHGVLLSEDQDDLRQLI